MDDWAEGLRTALVGRYTLERELGRGGMAIVYLAHDVRHGRHVALKVLRPELAPSLGGERFLREIRLAAGLQHPHILPLYDSGDAGGHLFYVMPYVEGESLRARLEREGPLPVDEAVRYAREVAEALAYAHGHDVVHRDIKPDNILLSGGHALVADFGIARAIDAAGGLKLTETGMAVGTPAYMSPEQALADAHVDGRADIYALGCVLYEMLAGAPPFTGSSAQAVIARHSSDAVPPLRTARPTVPDVVEAAIVKALAKTPADRFPTAAAFAAALPALDSGASLPALGRGHRARLPRAAVAAIVVILASLATWVVWQRVARARSNSPVVTSIAVVPLRNLGDSSDGYFADGLTQELTNALTRVVGLAPRPFATVSADAAKGGEPLALGRRLRVDYVLDGSVRRSGARFRVTVELVRVADGVAAWAPRSYDGSGADVFAMQDSITRQLVGELAGRLSPGASTRAAGRGRNDPEAYDLYLRGQHFLNLVNLDGAERAIALFGQAIARDSSFANAWVAMADAYGRLSQLSGRAPVQLWGLSRQAVDRAISLDSLNGDAYARRAGLRVIDWDYDGADRDYRRGIALDPGSANAHLYYAQYLNLVGLNDSALVVMRRAISLDPTNPSFFGANLATRLIWVGRLEEADAAARHSLALDSTQWVAHLMLAFVREREGDSTGAAREAELAHEGLGDVPFVLAPLAYYYARAGRQADAAATLEKLSEIGRREYVTGVWFALARLGFGDRRGALDALEASANARDADLTVQLGYGMFESLRGDPRYEALLRRVGLARFMRRH
jgi:serine/threonine-protein kinase